MIRKGIIVPVEGHSDWVNSLMIREKTNSKLRVCLDSKDGNKAIKRTPPSPNTGLCISQTTWIHSVLHANCPTYPLEHQIR